MTDAKTGLNATWRYAVILAIGIGGGVAFGQDRPVDQDARLHAFDIAAACDPPSSWTKQDAKIGAQICGAFTQGLTTGIYYMQAAAQRGMRTCMPNDAGLKPLEAEALFIDYLKAHPEQLAGTAGVVMTTAILNKYRC